ncbi:hypothetical protein H105_02326 [Trichophyton soudanense CBS 452.61]|nr:hypothetical protein H105_02326 [Trichophyton soudanense CBS 452.61]EZG08630.1 hypothetical protein H106_02181 [Trichophyton rubrum CBS 735.88]
MHALICGNIFIFLSFLNLLRDRAGLKSPVHIGVKATGRSSTARNHLIITFFFCARSAIRTNSNIWPVPFDAYTPTHREVATLHPKLIIRMHPASSSRSFWTRLDLWINQCLSALITAFNQTIIRSDGVFTHTSYRDDEPRKATYRHTTHGWAGLGLTRFPLIMLLPLFLHSLPLCRFLSILFFFPPPILAIDPFFSLSPSTTPFHISTSCLTTAPLLFFSMWSGLKSVD